jgi:hypothetical protein
MRQACSCPNCNSLVHYGDEFCLQCKTQLLWQQQTPTPPIGQVSHDFTRQPLYFEQQEKSKWQREDPESDSNWRKAAVPVLAFLILIGIGAGALQMTVWGKTGNSSPVSASTISRTSNNTTGVLSTSANITQSKGITR